MSFFGELRRRDVVKVAVAYAIAAWLLVQIAVSVEGPLNLPAWTDTLVIVLLAGGFFVALFVAWVYELTPDGVRQTESAPPSKTMTQTAGQKLNYAVIAALVLALGFIVYNYVLVEPDQPLTVQGTMPTAAPAAASAGPAAVEGRREVLPNSVAVLLCDNLSPDPDDAYIAASIHEEILNQLVKIRALNVIARTSVLRYAAAPPPIPQIAEELNVGSIMECSVRFAGDAIMVTAQLIDPKTNTHLWSETYPGDLSDLSAVFAMQADIAMNIANALQAEFSSGEQARLERQPTVSAEAYTLFLRALSGGFNNAQDPLNLLEAAIELDPAFALAYGAKAQLIATQLRFGIERTAAREQLVIDSAEKALSLDPDVATAQLALAAVHELNWQRAEAERAYARVYQLYPSDPNVALAYAVFKRSAGEYSEAIRLHQIAARLDPNNLTNWHQLGVTYLHAKNSDAAVTALQNALALGPNAVASTFELGNAYLTQGNLSAAGDVFRAVETVPFFSTIPFLQAMVAMGYERAGFQADAERVFAAMEKPVPADSAGNISLAIAYIAIHDYERAFSELERAINGPAPLEINASIELKINRWEHPVLEEPRFVALRNRLGFQD